MPNTKTIQLAISGMSCNGCANAVKRSLGEVSGVLSTRVDLNSGSARVELEGESGTSVNDLIEAVRDAGYDASAAAKS